MMMSPLSKQLQSLTPGVLVRLEDQDRSHEVLVQVVQSLPLGELRTLEEQLGFDSKDIPNQGQTVEALEFLRWVKNRGALPTLQQWLQALGKERADFPPLAPKPYHGGRTRELADLRRLMEAAGRNAPVLCAISGLSGVGKSVLARLYAERFRENYSAVHWISANDQAALNWLAQRPPADSELPWLLIIDKADPPEHLQNVLPITGRGHVLLTTQSQNTAMLQIYTNLRFCELGEAELEGVRQAGRLEINLFLDNFTTEDALEFLWQRAGFRWESMPPAEKEAAGKLVELLQSYPSALELAAQHIAGNYLFSAYLEEFKATNQHFLESSLVQPFQHPEQQAAISTFALSVRSLDQSQDPMEQAAADLLRACAHLKADEDIPLLFLLRSGQELGLKLSPILRSRQDLLHTVAKLYRCSLVQWDLGTQSLRLSRTVQEYVRWLQDDATVKLWVRRLVNAATEALKHTEGEHICVPMLPHIRRLAQQSETCHSARGEVAEVLRQAAAALRKIGRLSDAQDLLNDANRIYEGILLEAQSALLPVLIELVQMQHLRNDCEAVHRTSGRILQLCQGADSFVTENLYHMALQHCKETRVPGLEELWGGRDDLGHSG